MLHRQRLDKFTVEDKQVPTNGYGTGILRDTHVIPVSFAVIMTGGGAGTLRDTSPSTSNEVRVIS